jgi:hypothetical protein
MNPELFEGKSLTALATALGIDKQSLSKLASSASRKFTIENRGQAHGWNRGLKASKHAHNQLTASLSSPDPSPTTPPVAMFHNETPSRVKESFNDVEAGQVRQQHPTHLPS